MTDDAPFLLDVTRLIWRRWKGRHPTGIDRVCLAYLNHFAARAQAVVHHKLFRRTLDREASRELFALLEESPQHFRRKLPLGLLRNLKRLNCAGHNRLYLNIGHTGLNSVGFRNWVARTNVRPVYLVHDLIPITHPEFCRAGESEKHRERMRTILSTAVGVIGNSQATLDELAGFANEERLPVPPGLAAWLGSDALPKPTESHVPDRPTFVILGTIEGRKNHLMLLRIWSRLIDCLGSAAPRLQVIGQRGWEAEAVFDMLDRNDKLRGHVVELNHCSDEALVQHLSSARALLFPSVVEGFGLPLVEALRMGIPVIASDVPVFREIGGDIPTYLDPRDEAGWESAIAEYSQDRSAVRAAQLDRITGFRAPTWPEHFERVEAWLGTLG